MTSCGERLREERERLGYSQPAFGALGGKSKQTLIQWEAGEQYPNAAFLDVIAAVGADIQYIVTGQRSTQALTTEEQELIGLWRAANLQGKGTAIAALTAGTAHNKTKQVVHGPVGQQAGGDITNQQGTKIEVGKGSKSGGSRIR